MTLSKWVAHLRWGCGAEAADIYIEAFGLHVPRKRLAEACLFLCFFATIPAKIKPPPPKKKTGKTPKIAEMKALRNVYADYVVTGGSHNRMPQESMLTRMQKFTRVAVEAQK